MPTLLLTGSNRGIGLELVRQFAAKSWRIVATCRDPENAEELRNLELRYPDLIDVKPLDVTDQSASESLCSSLDSKGVSVNLVICNAGVINAQPFGSWTQTSFVDTVNTNAIAPGILIQAARKILAKKAKVLLISSGIGSLCSPLLPEGPMDAYAISKAALNMMTIRLAEKMKAQDIPVVAISPGWVKTDMGGPEAELEVGQSVSALISTFEVLDMRKTGRFIDRFGKEIPW